jgi:putative pyruvate formate lyase activating enzyme
MPSADRFTVSAAAPAYLAARVRRGLPERVAWARAALACCRACPRACAADRRAAERGYCGVGRCARVASAFAHHGEEDCLRGTRGSGTIFFSGCNLHCVFCQNWDISQRQAGRELNADQTAQLMLDLQDEGCHNVNLVTPEHVVPQVIEAVALAIEHGLRIPIVYNTSAYDAVDSLCRLDGLVDIYMPDFKFWTRASSARLCDAPDYPVRARAALREMHRQVGDLCFTPDGVAARGLLIRHLVLPGLLDESRAIFAWLARGLSPDTYVNIMAQYQPAHELARPPRAGAPRLIADLHRPPTRAEQDAAHAAARAAGLRRFDARRARG